MIPEPRVSADCFGTTAEQFVACLFGPDANFIVRHSAEGSKAESGHPTAELWVLQSSLQTAEPAGVGGEAGACAPPRREDSSPRPAVAAVKSDIDASARLVEWATAGDPERRMQGLSRLANEGAADDPTVQRTLQSAMADEDADVRAQAIAGLARQGGDGVASVLQQGLHDRDASVRLMAVDQAGNDPQGLALLREALADSDDTVSALAAMKLGSRRNASMTN